MTECLSIKKASEWATAYLRRKVTTSNIAYLVQYGQIPKVYENGSTQIKKADLVAYYERVGSARELKWRDQLGCDLNWTLSFVEYKESETTKHVHRLHPYKGKFIPQLVAYFLDTHTDSFKREVFFRRGDTVLDPFCGSGTTLVQANELGIHALGIDISAFNALISNVKVEAYDWADVRKTAREITSGFIDFLSTRRTMAFENKLLSALKDFNQRYFPAPEYRLKVRRKQIDERVYAMEREAEFLPLYNGLVKEYGIALTQKGSERFLDKWFIREIRADIDFVWEAIKKVQNEKTRQILSVVLSRTIRSCRATRHSDLGTLLEPQFTPYYCKKHGKICKPLFSILNWWNRYVADTVKRLVQFDKLRTPTSQICLTGDSRAIDLVSELEAKNPAFAIRIKNKKIDGIFSSPPYVGLIDYHEQHAYSYDLFGFKRRDDLEIGPLYKGQGIEARKRYVQGVADVLNHSKKYLKRDYDVFLIANDKYGLYPTIAQSAGMRIVNQYKRPVLNRVEKDRNAYAEIVFHLKEMH
ncbi:MAG: DNA methyltransferase [Flavobacteriales bacterium]